MKSVTLKCREISISTVSTKLHVVIHVH